MGINQQVVKQILPVVAPNSCVEFSGAPPCVTAEIDVIYDFTGLIYGLRRGQDEENYMMTTEQFFDAMDRLVLRMCTGMSSAVEKVNRVIVCLDKRKFVPRGKEFRTKTNPYSPDATFGADGVLDKGVWSRIDMRRLAESGSLATAALHGYVENRRELQRVFPCPVVFDYQRPEPPFCPVRFCSSEWPGEASFMWEWENFLGETDLMINFYLDILRPTSHGVCIIHRDSDQIPLSLCYLLARPTHQHPTRLYWISRLPDAKANKPGLFYNLLQMTDEIGNNDRFFSGLVNPHVLPRTSEARLSAFVLFIQLCGTDWTEKGRLSDYICLMDVWEAVAYTWPLWQQLVHEWQCPGPWDKKASGLEIETVDLFVRWQYSLLITNREQGNSRRKKPAVIPPPPRAKSWEEIIHYMNSNELTRYKRNCTPGPPLREDRHMAWQTLRFVTRYWRSSWQVA